MAGHRAMIDRQSRRRLGHRHRRLTVYHLVGLEDATMLIGGQHTTAPLRRELEPVQPRVPETIPAAVDPLPLGSFEGRNWNGDEFERSLLSSVRYR